MLFLNRHQNIKKTFLIGLLMVLLFVTSGLAVLAYPKKADAQLPTMDLRQILNNILVGIWKAVVFPLIQKIVVGFLTTGEFPMTGDEMLTWLYKDLAFQTLEVILNQFNITLCTEFSANVRLALQNITSDEYTPDCTFDESWLATTIEEAVLEGSDAAWAKVKSDFLGSFSINVETSNNVYSRWFEVQDTFRSERARAEGDLRLELGANTGFLGRRDCSQWQESRDDRNNDGERQDNECPVTSPGESVSSLFNGYEVLQGASAGSEVLADLVGLLGTIIDLVINQAIGGIAKAIESGRSDTERSAAEEYQEVRSQRTGENQTIEH